MDIETLDFDDLFSNKDITSKQESIVQNFNESDNKTIIETKKEDNLLPLGSVVMLKGATKRLMIVGFYPLNEELNGKSHDYVGCIFPEGIMASDNFALFNNDQIEKVFYEGLSDKEENDFKIRLNELFETL